jgi:excisionase family DNA binding protein
MTNTSAPPHITHHELADLLGVHRTTVTRAVRRGDIKTALLCGRRVIPRAEAARLLQELGLELEANK